MPRQLCLEYGSALCDVMNRGDRGPEEGADCAALAGGDDGEAKVDRGVPAHAHVDLRG
jgi:hypothetical protein